MLLQALLEMADVSGAQAMINYYSERPPQIRGHTVYVQFSNHDQLKTEVSTQVRLSFINFPTIPPSISDRFWINVWLGGLRVSGNSFHRLILIYTLFYLLSLTFFDWNTLKCWLHIVDDDRVYDELYIILVRWYLENWTRPLATALYSSWQMKIHPYLLMTDAICRALSTQLHSGPNQLNTYSWRAIWSHKCWTLTVVFNYSLDHCKAVIPSNKKLTVMDDGFIFEVLALVF